MSRLRPLDPSAALVASRFPRGTLSKVAGAGTGTGLIVWAEMLNISPTLRLVLQASAPWFAVTMAGVGPYLSAFLVAQVRYYGLLHTLKRAKKFAATIAEGAPNKAQIEANVAELEMLVSDLIQDGARFWIKTDPKTVTESGVPDQPPTPPPPAPKPPHSN